MSPPPELQQLALNFLVTFCVISLVNNNLHTVSGIFYMQLSSAWSLYIALSSLIFPFANLYTISLPIRPFQGPLYTAIGPFFPRALSPPPS